MNFFESQERSRKNTTLLVALFAMAVIALIIMSNVLVMFAFGLVNTAHLSTDGDLLRQIDWQRFAAISVGVGIVVLGGSLYKIAALSAGGKVVAEALGGRLIPQNTQNLQQRKLLNVVEEMAIASGTPVPPVYLLADEPGINAFAAGFSPRDAVIGVTQGTIDQLNREQLQGVIAHEFSHIFNGDMKLNIRLIGVLNGILVLGIIGYHLLRSSSFSGRRRGNSKDGGGILALGLGLMAIGFAGTFFGNLIKAAVSRQREYLADASAVQFTRNPGGIAGALKRIGGLAAGSEVHNPGAQEVSHAFFAQGVSGLMQWLSATHPPLKDRIRRIDPHWDGRFDTSPPSNARIAADEADARRSAQATEKRRADAQKMVAAGSAAAGTVAADVMAMMDQVGQPGLHAVDHARTLLAELPTAIKDAAREPYGARAVIYSMAFNPEQTVRIRQLNRLEAHADPGVYALTRTLMTAIGELDIKFRLPLVDLAIPALKQLSVKQYLAFAENLSALIKMDSRVDLLEWSLKNIVFRHLDGHFRKPTRAPTRYSELPLLWTEIEIVLSVMAYAGAENHHDVQGAFNAAVQALESNGPKLLPRRGISATDLDQALAQLDQMTPQAKSRFLKACVAGILYDQRATAVEIELLRAFASVLDCPMPPGVA